MKKITLIIPVIGIALALGCNNAQENKSTVTDKKDTTKVAKAPAPAPKMDSAAMVKSLQESMMPGEMHKMLATYDGKWNGDISIWPSPGAAPIKTKGTCVTSMILGGRYQRTETKGEFAGMPMEGVKTLGYDNAQKIFFTSWIDNMGTGVMNAEGTYDSTTKTITFKGKFYDPASGKEVEEKELFKFIDKNTQLEVMYVLQDGKEFKSMEITYTRK